jgi:sigma-B regulation protein RsbU (phosphoserine phosphatase)
MKAGTMVTITKSLFNSLASSKDILKTFKRISEVIKNMKFRQLSMCLQMIKINGSEFSISSAAMPPAFIYRLDEESVEEILLSGMPLGAMLNYKYKIEKRNLKSGDVIFLLSDGLPELHNYQKHMYGYDRVKTELKIIGKKSPQEIVAHFEQSANEWLNGHEQDDDVTFVVIKIK